MKIPTAPLATLTPAALRAHLARTPTPLILKGLTNSWPKTADWHATDAEGKLTLDALRNVVGEDTAVEVEVGRRGRGYLDPDWQRVTMGFGLFLDAFILSRIPSADPAALPAGYLAQSGLLDSCNALTHTIPELSHFRSGASGDIYRRTMWVGPSGSFTPFHRDPNVGIYTQIVGRKVFHLLPPTEDVVACLEPSARELHKNTSTIPVSVRAVFEGGEGTRAMDRCRENLSKAFEAPGACEARLEQGDSVLIPEGWWHSAEGDGVGVGVNAWFK